jgi:polyisoprenoid-binding protein YceI
MKRFLFSLILVSVILVPALASAKAWEIDPVHSSITFKIRHFFAKVQGSFNEMSGTIDFEPEDPAAGSVEVTIPAASIDTRIERRDNDLRSSNFFDVENHPEITFKSTKVEQTEDGLKVIGDLAMHGVTKEVVLDVDFLGAGPHARPGMMVAGFSASTTIDRTEWGLKWNRTLDAGGVMLGNDVEIVLDVEAVHKEPAEE